MTIKEYQDLAMRTNDGLCNARLRDKVVMFAYLLEHCDHDSALIANGYDPGELINGALGLTGEAGEVADLIKKDLFHGHNCEMSELVKELGDVCWYIALLCHAIGVSFEDVAKKNIEKLKARYPDGFSESASINRTE